MAKSLPLISALVCLAAVCAQDPLTRVPVPRFHLTARPWSEIDYSRQQILERVEGVCRAAAQFQDDAGAIIDPYLDREHQYSTPYFAFAASVLIDAGRAADLLPVGIAAMEKSTADFAGGAQAIPDAHGEFFIAPLTQALALYRPHVPAEQWQRWHDRMATPLTTVMRDQHGRINNWRTYAMRGEWLRAVAGLVDHEEAIQFIETAWHQQTQRERITGDRWNLYQDWSSDPQSLAVEAVGRVNLLAMLHAGYDGPSAAAMWRAVRRGTKTTLLLQAPDGQAPPGGRTDNHVFNDVLYQLAFELMATDAAGRDDDRLAGRYRRAAALSFQSIHRWRRNNGKWKGSFFVTKNHLDPAARVGYQPASQWSNYGGAVMMHLAEAALVFDGQIKQQPAPSETGGYALQTDDQFGAFVANAGGHQVFAHLRGASVPKYGRSWTPLGVVRFGRAGWDGRLGPSDGEHEPGSHTSSVGGSGVTFAPVWRERGQWVRMADLPEHYQAEATVSFVHPLLVRFSLTYRYVTGRGGPYFRHDFIVTPDGTLTKMVPLQPGESGVTIPLLSDDGRPLEMVADRGIASTRYREGSDQQSFIAIGDDAVMDQTGDPMLSSYGLLQAIRVTNAENVIHVLVYPHDARDPSAQDVQNSFELTDHGFRSVLGWVDRDLYRGRTSAGGVGKGIDLDHDGERDVTFSQRCQFVLRIRGGRVVTAEADRDVEMEYQRRRLKLRPYRTIWLDK